MSLTLSILTNDNQEVLLRAVGELNRRSLVIQSLSWTPLDSGDYEMIVTINGDEHRLSRIVYQLARLINVLEVNRVERREPTSESGMRS